MLGFFSIYHLILLRFNKLPMEKVLLFFFFFLKGRSEDEYHFVFRSSEKTAMVTDTALSQTCWSVNGHRTLRKGFLDNLHYGFSVPFSDRKG